MSVSEWNMMMREYYFVCGVMWRAYCGERLRESNDRENYETPNDAVSKKKKERLFPSFLKDFLIILKR